MNRLGRILIVIFLILAALAVYFGVRHMIDVKKANEQMSQPISETIATSTDTSSYKLDLPTATTTVPDGWKTFSSDKLGFSVSYPTNLLLTPPSTSVSGSTATPNTLSFSFSKDIYFHWPLQDEVVLSITASTSCRDMLVPTGPFTSTTTFSMNGYSFTATEGDDAAAGNRYQEIAYDTQGNGKCYHISLYDHGVNGAGFYVDGQALVQKYDDQHDVDMSAVISILNSMTSSFRLQSPNMVQ